MFYRESCFVLIPLIISFLPCPFTFSCRSDLSSMIFLSSFLPSESVASLHELRFDVRFSTIGVLLLPDLCFTLLQVL
ncbi:hypothetical protein ES288_D11G212800v1 [Gossypium darwinii]|uniref:Secreted peptide n=1 Tax=Gossypium darwinii TaxID=34276 RepID=A0A5D2ANH4_GOSDA|nr:hypothetical protein ES288_D11G212800v1 [Gossypium darwinii]